MNAERGAGPGEEVADVFAALVGVEDRAVHVPAAHRGGHAQRAQFVDAYNHRRRHSFCEMLAPVAYEALITQRAAEAARTDRAA